MIDYHKMTDDQQPRASLLSLVLSLVLIPAVLIKERAGAPGEVLAADVHVGVLNLLVVVLMSV